MISIARVDWSRRWTTCSSRTTGWTKSCKKGFRNWWTAGRKRSVSAFVTNNNTTIYKVLWHVRVTTRAPTVHLFSRKRSVMAFHALCSFIRWTAVQPLNRALWACQPCYGAIEIVVVIIIIIIIKGVNGGTFVSFHKCCSRCSFQPVVCIVWLSDCRLPSVFTCVSYAEAHNRYNRYRLDVRLSVRPSVARWHCIKTAEYIVMLSSPHNSPFILVLCVDLHEIPTGSSPAGALNTGGV